MAPRDTPEEQGVLLTVGAAAERVGVSVDTIRRWADQGHLPCVRTPGRQRRFRAADVDALYQPDPSANATPEAVA